MKRVLIIVASTIAGVVCALVLLPQRTHTVTVRPGLLRVTAAFDDGAAASFRFVNLDGRAQMQDVPGVFVEHFDGGTHSLELLVNEPSHNSSAKYVLEVVVEGPPVKQVQDVTVDVWRVTPRGMWNAAKNRWTTTRILGTTRNMTVHVRTADGGAVVDAGVVCDMTLGKTVKTDARGDADCGLQKGALNISVWGGVGTSQNVPDGVADVNYTFEPL